jgi:hypothetical protein
LLAKRTKDGRKPNGNRYGIIAGASLALSLDRYEPLIP